MEQNGWHRVEETGHYRHTASVLIHAPVETCFSYWSNLENLPEIMSHIKTVTMTSENTSHWEAEMMGQHLEWEARTTEYRENDLISWVSTSGVENSGSVQFHPSEHGCVLLVTLAYDPPYGIAGDLVARGLLADRFQHDLVNDLAQFKTMVERRAGGERAA